MAPGVLRTGTPLALRESPARSANDFHPAKGCRWFVESDKTYRSLFLDRSVVQILVGCDRVLNLGARLSPPTLAA